MEPPPPCANFEGGLCCFILCVCVSVLSLYTVVVSYSYKPSQYPFLMLTVCEAFIRTHSYFIALIFVALFVAFFSHLQL